VLYVMRYGAVWKNLMTSLSTRVNDQFNELITGSCLPCNKENGPGFDDDE